MTLRILPMTEQNKDQVYKIIELWVTNNVAVNDRVEINKQKYKYVKHDNRTVTLNKLRARVHGEHRIQLPSFYANAKLLCEKPINWQSYGIDTYVEHWFIVDCGNGENNLKRLCRLWREVGSLYPTRFETESEIELRKHLIKLKLEVTAKNPLQKQMAMEMIDNELIMHNLSLERLLIINQKDI